MNAFGGALTRLFSLLLRPFENGQAFAGIIVASVVTGAVMMWLFKLTSNQQAMKVIKTKIAAYFLEMRLSYTEVRLVDDAGAEVGPDQVGHLQIRGANVTGGYFGNPTANAAAITADGWLRTGDLALTHDGQYYVTGRSKEIIFVNGQNYYPYDLESVVQHEPGLDHGKVVAAGVQTAGSPTDELILFVLHRGSMTDFVPLATRAVHLVNEHAGVEVARVVPVKRIPKTTSGKLQRTALAQAYENGEFAAEIAEFDAAWQAAHGHGRAAAGRIEQQLKAIVDDALPGKHVYNPSGDQCELSELLDRSGLRHRNRIDPLERRGMGRDIDVEC